jgi:FkbM family methyltransferase
VTGRLRDLIPERIRVWALRGLEAVFARLGYELRPKLEIPLTSEEARRSRLLRSRGITVVLDVGANAGMYGRQLRRIGFDSRVVSFEPLSDAYAELEELAREDPLWECRRVALGSSDGSAEINVAGNSTSSSLLGMEERHLESAPESKYVGTEEVPLARLDSIWGELVGEEDRVFLKLDVQGFELEVLNGAAECLRSVDCVQAELSFVSLYEGAPDYRELIDFLRASGFRLAGLEEGHDDQHTGEMLQADGIFVREP